MVLGMRCCDTCTLPGALVSVSCVYLVDGKVEGLVEGRAVLGRRGCGGQYVRAQSLESVLEGEECVDS